jgi:hypothetical protein
MCVHILRIQDNSKSLVTTKSSASSRTATTAQTQAAEASQQNSDKKDIDLDDLNANLVYFKGARPYDHPGFPDEKFPNQKIPLP